MSKVLALFLVLGISDVFADGGSHRHGRNNNGFSSSSSYNGPIDNGYSAPGDGGIFSNGYQSSDADFGNTFAAQNDQPVYASSDDQAVYDNGGDPGIAMLEKSVPGVPGEDYPIYSEVPETGFTCDGQVDGGYYADPEAECQVFHICTTDGRGGLTTYSFLCPNGTVFNQEYFICDWWFNFDCAEAEGLYSRNDEIAAEREALSAQASYGQPTYASPDDDQNQYNEPAPAASSTSNSYASPSSNSYSAGPSNGNGRKNGNGGKNGNGRKKGNGRRKNGNGKRRNNGGQRRNGGSNRSNNNNAVAPSSNYGSASASNGYGSPADSGYGSPSASPANNGYGSPSAAAPAANGYGAPSSSPAGNGYGAPADDGYGAPADDSYGAPADESYGAPTAAAPSSYGAPSSDSYGAPSSDSYGSPSSDYDQYDDLPSYSGKK